MSLFPFISVSDDIALATESNELPLLKEIKWDFVKDKAILKDGNFVTVEGKEALEVWIYKAIKTYRYYYDIYTDNYGCEILSLMGKGFTNAYIKSEVYRYISEALSVNPYITQIKDVKVDFSKDILSVTVKVASVYGNVEILA